MTDSYGKRKWAGEPMKDRRKADPGPLRTPPHKKPKSWGLEVTWTITETRIRVQRFTSKAARDEARQRIEAHMRDIAAKEAKFGKSGRYSRYGGGDWRSNPFVTYGFSDDTVHTLKDGPHFAESYDDGSAQGKEVKP